MKLLPRSKKRMYNTKEHQNTLSKQSKSSERRKKQNECHWTLELEKWRSKRKIRLFGMKILSLDVCIIYKSLNYVFLQKFFDFIDDVLEVID